MRIASDFQVKTARWSLFNTYFPYFMQGEDGRTGSQGPPGLPGPKVSVSEKKKKKWTDWTDVQNSLPIPQPREEIGICPSHSQWSILGVRPFRGGSSILLRRGCTSKEWRHWRWGKTKKKLKASTFIRRRKLHLRGRGGCAPPAPSP